MFISLEHKYIVTRYPLRNALTETHRNWFVIFLLLFILFIMIALDNLFRISK